MYESYKKPPKTATAVNSIQKMKELRRLKNQKGHMKLAGQDIDKKNKLSHFVEEKYRYDADRG
jgi:hypothetical protein